MLVLGIDTATRTASIGLTDQERIVGEFSLQVERVHSKRLMPMVDQLLTSAGLDVNQVEGIAVSAGPGSFTGLRIGMATAKGLAYALSIPLVGVSTLSGLCFNCGPVEGLVCPILDARMNQYYTGLYEWQDGRPTPIIQDGVVNRQELVQMLEQDSRLKVIVAEQDLDSTLGLKERFPQMIRHAPDHLVYPRGSSIAVLGFRKINSGAEDALLSLQPTYLRRSQAEILFDRKNKV